MRWYATAWRGLQGGANGESVEGGGAGWQGSGKGETSEGVSRRDCACCGSCLISATVCTKHCRPPSPLSRTSTTLSPMPHLPHLAGAIEHEQHAHLLPPVLPHSHPHRAPHLPHLAGTIEHEQHAHLLPPVLPHSHPHRAPHLPHLAATIASTVACSCLLSAFFDMSEGLVT